MRKYDYVCSIRDKYVEIIYEYYKVLLGGYVLSNINLDINLEVEKKESRLIYNLSKRIIDIIGSLIGLILLSPILIIVGILIKFESKGPIVFTQKRVGKDGKEFDMYKLRSMVVNAEEIKVIYNLSKRIIDIIGSLIGLILLSPILIIVGILIKFESKGPIVFTQKRVGKDGKEFDMYKLRSMVVNAEEIKEKLKEQNEMSGPMFKMKDDPRITKVGKFIRKTSIDELPQLINVLKGDMSLVGPRPSLPNEVKEFETWMLKRLNVKPGLTCYWQVMGRNNIDFEDWMKLDVKYVNERSFCLDIKLIFKTVFVLFGDRNAA